MLDLGIDLHFARIHTNRHVCIRLCVCGNIYSHQMFCSRFLKGEAKSNYQQLILKVYCLYEGIRNHRHEVFFFFKELQLFSNPLELSVLYFCKDGRRICIPSVWRKLLALWHDVDDDAFLCGVMWENLIGGKNLTNIRNFKISWRHFSVSVLRKTHSFNFYECRTICSSLRCQTYEEFCFDRMMFAIIFCYSFTSKMCERIQKVLMGLSER